MLAVQQIHYYIHHTYLFLPHPHALPVRILGKNSARRKAGALSGALRDDE
jgi:hypothetical protein